SLSSLFSFPTLFRSWLAPIALAVYTFAVHYSLFRLNLNRPPGNFFFTMITAVAIAQPQDISHFASDIGYVSLGVMISFVIGLIYSLLTLGGADWDDPVGVLWA